MPCSETGNLDCMGTAICTGYEGSRIAPRMIIIAEQRQMESKAE